MNLKTNILFAYKSLLQNRLSELQHMIADLTIDAQNDAKGSAGDKHETGLAMMHLEQEKLNYKLREVLEQVAVLDKIDATAVHQKVALGSVVKTNVMWLFVSSAMPKITVENTIIFAVSPNAPLGMQLMGNGVGHTFEINGKQYVIEEIQ